MSINIRKTFSNLPSIIFIVTCLFFLLPSIDFYYSNKFIFFNIWIVRVLAVTILFKYIKKRSLSKYLFFMLLFFSYIIVDTWFFKSDIVTALSQSYCSIAIVCLFEFYFKKKPKIFIEIGVNFLLFLITINCVFMFVNITPFGEDVYLFGIKNQLGLQYIIAIVLAEIERKTFNKKVYKEIYLLIVIIISLLKAQSSNNFIALGILFISIIISNNSNIINKINYKIIYIFVLSIDYAIVVLNFQEKFNWLIQGILHKSLTLTSRTFIWENAVYKISQNPIWGYGVKKDYNIFQVLDRSQYTVPVVNLSAHNQFLQTTYEGGLIALIGFILISLFLLNELNKLNKLSKSQKELSCNFVVLMGYISTTIICFAEAPGIIQLFTYLGLLNGYIYLILSRKQNILSM